MNENERIRELRIAKNLTLAKFGEVIGLSPGAVSDMERGRRGVTDQTIRSICREFRVNEEWLRDGKGDIFKPDTRDEIESLAKRYNLSFGIQVFIEKLVNSEPEVQDAVISLITETAESILNNEIHAEHKVGKEAQNTDDTEAAEAAYRQALGIAPQTKSTALSSIEGTPADSSEEADGVC